MLTLSQGSQTFRGYGYATVKNFRRLRIHAGNGIDSLAGMGR